jgi:hypothetical protein
MTGAAWPKPSPNVMVHCSRDTVFGIGPCVSFRFTRTIGLMFKGGTWGNQGSTHWSLAVLTFTPAARRRAPSASRPGRQWTARGDPGASRHEQPNVPVVSPPLILPSCVCACIASAVRHASSARSSAAAARRRRSCLQRCSYMATPWRHHYEAAVDVPVAPRGVCHRVDARC